MKSSLKKAVTLCFATSVVFSVLLIQKPLTVNAATNEASMYRLYNPNSGEHFYTQSKYEYTSLNQGGWAGEEYAWTAPTTCAPVYRLYNPNSGQHVLSGNNAEKKMLSDLGWIYEGVAFETYESIPVYRLYNPNSGEHFYTMNASERDLLASLGWSYENVPFCSINGGLPVYRLYNPNSGLHHYTINGAEKDMLVSYGWGYEGESFYVDYGVNRDVNEEDINMEYDDERGLPMSCNISSVQNGVVTSHKVRGGKVLDETDDSVIEFVQENGNNIMYASGVGSCNLNFNDGVYTYHYKVKVEPATLTIMYLMGQSNMRGYTSMGKGAPFEQDKENSVLNKRGETYAIYDRRINYLCLPAPSGIAEYLPKDDNDFNNGAGIHVPGALSRDNETSICETYIGKRGGLNGNMLDDFNEYGTGKCGMDSALCYEYNRLTGEKVLCVNTAIGGQVVQRWSDDQLGLNASVVSKMLYDAEIQSGHYKRGHSLAFWMQGETDSVIHTSYDTYRERFMRFYTNYKAQLGIEKIGVIMPRCCRGADDDGTWYLDVEMNDMRRALYDLCSEEGNDVVLVSDVNKQWITDDMTAQYFSIYNGTFPYPLRAEHTVDHVPNRVDDVHRDIHFRQIGHNENGRTAAIGMVKVIQ